MNHIILALLLLNDYVPTNIESFLEAKGKLTKVDEQQVYMVQIPKEVWSNINQGRKLHGRATIEYPTLLKEPFYNREYATDWINLTKNELAEELKREITEEELFVTWLIGQKAFRKLGFKIENIKDELTLTKLSLFKKSQKERDRSEVHEPPPPLPSDGRPSVPRRYPVGPETRASYK